MRGKENIYKDLWKEHGNGPKPGWSQPVTSEIIKWEYQMQRTLNGTLRQKSTNTQASGKTVLVNE